MTILRRTTTDKTEMRKGRKASPQKQHGAQLQRAETEQGGRYGEKKLCISSAMLPWVSQDGKTPSLFPPWYPKECNTKFKPLQGLSSACREKMGSLEEGWHLRC